MTKELTAPLMRKIMDRIQDASKASDVVKIGDLSRAAARVSEIEKHLGALMSELEKIESSLDQSVPSKLSFSFALPPSSPRGEIEITVDWSAINVARPKAHLSEPKASETLVAFISELKAGLGASALEALTGLQVNRGPLLSQNPSVDFANQKRGTEYAHHPIPGTKYHVLTHSSTAEKLDTVREAWRFLGLPPSALSASRAQ